ncbi:MAG: helix-turn-helix transcriptional regulator [Spirochaetales bacterium]|jgi:DNA-binding HxlR family transcriptional regulator|nr:helix-turn-helix transcriptional regulator [Spirochaetales bacterium]
MILAVQLRSEIERKFKNHEFTCEKELTMSIISGKYKVVIIWHLGNEGPHRFGELFKLFAGISNRILTKQLRDLEQDGIISRRVYPVVPLKVEYFLTERGKTLLPIVNDIWRWGKENMRYYYERFLTRDTAQIRQEI